MDETKPDCYKCAYRKGLPGDVHSRCAHPVVDMMDMVSKLETEIPKNEYIRAENNYNAASVLEIRGSMHGIGSGWFHWPWNYDPVWLRNCKGFITTEDYCLQCDHSLVCAVGGLEWENEDGSTTGLKHPPECWRNK